ncbi:EamA family transporter [Verrucomicrobiota bacterium]
MSLTAIVLIIISAVMHAGWNLLSKRTYPSASFFLAANIAAFILLSPVLVLYAQALPGFPPRVWALVAGTGCFMSVYYTSLAGAYRSGDMSVAYPLARSSPVIVVTIVTLILGRGSQVSAQCVFGIVLVVGGCLLVPMKRITDLRVANYLNATCCLALVAAFGTAGYSILDDEALRQLRNAPELCLGTTQITLVYACLEALSASLWLGFFVAVRRKGRRDFLEVIRRSKLQAVLTGAAIYLTYAIVLISLAYVRNVSYVVAFRQLSIPLGTAFGIFILREPPYIPKLAGVTVMLVGLVLIGMG